MTLGRDAGRETRRGEPTPTSADLASGAQARRTRALVCGGATWSGKTFVSQCAPEVPIGATSRQKVSRYQRTAHFVLNQAVGRDASGHSVVRPTGGYGIFGGPPTITRALRRKT